MNVQVFMDKDRLIKDGVEVILTDSGSLMIRGDVPLKYVESVMFRRGNTWIKVFDSRLVGHTWEGMSNDMSDV